MRRHLPRLLLVVTLVLKSGISLLCFSRISSHPHTPTTWSVHCSWCKNLPALAFLWSEAHHHAMSDCPAISLGLSSNFLSVSKSWAPTLSCKLYQQTVIGPSLVPVDQHAFPSESLPKGWGYGFMGSDLDKTWIQTLAQPYPKRKEFFPASATQRAQLS